MIQLIKIQQTKFLINNFKKNTMDILFKYSANTLGILTPNGALVGDKITVGYTEENLPIQKQISHIIEQRREKGTYVDESKRKMWTKVEVAEL